ncbi:probable pectinesterase 29 [Phtheirospermum japonicum]|uniref:Pectinesterase n=1 Tax=Phtheirospermum japonicum TaxID=374723 RepID=A0A830CFC3_9LAMI|nr:probable pectinesterase 29 [Phtheirospermum japonicum]
MLSCLTTLLALSLAFSSTTTSLQDTRKNRITYSSIYVDPSGQANFKTIQAAIDSVPSHNTRWTCIHIKRGTYREQVIIPRDKPFIYLKGEGKRITNVVWDAHDSIATSATFTSQADYTIAKCITFVNSYNSPPNGNPMRPALAAMIQGDKSAFYRCGFIGLQDTLWDVQGRHYFKLCTIQGAVDFIFGSGQSLYERCTISVVARALNGVPGYITAQARTHDQETNGFVFKDCNIVGNGQTYLGRPWRDHARVLFYETSMSQVVVPQGWDAWYSAGHEYQLTFAEQNCRGLGSNTSSRVKWIKKLSEEELEHLTSFSFIDDEGWVSSLAFDLFAG